MKMSVKLTETGNPVKNFKDITDLEKLRAYVGIPEAKSPRRKNKKQKVTNAELLYIHTNGSPAKGIPSRPVIEPAITAPGNVEPITQEMKEAAQGALHGKREDALRHMKRAGLTGENASRNWFTDPRNNWLPNKPSTIRRKKSSRPLIDTGELRKAITSVVTQE